METGFTSVMRNRLNISKRIAVSLIITQCFMALNSAAHATTTPAKNLSNSSSASDSPGTPDASSSTGASIFNSSSSSTSNTPIAASKATKRTPRRKHSKDRIRTPVFEKHSDPYSTTLSPDAVLLAKSLNLIEPLERLSKLKQQAKQGAATGAVSVSLRQDITELRTDILEVIEQTRLEIDFTSAEIEEEQATVEEVLKWYVNERDVRVERANRWAFRTNGILWAAAESFTIPSYKDPRFSIPSGTLGIIAGLVPSIFSSVALRSSGGRHHDRRPHPNMLCKIYDYPVIPRTDYPESVWNYINSKPTNSNLTRREVLRDHWVHNDNIFTLQKGENDERLRKITGIDQSDVSIDLLNDRASMLRDLHAAVMEMTRPLMEISMCLRGKKDLVVDTSSLQH